MMFDFRNPLMLLMIIPVTAYIVITSAGMHITPKWKKRTILFLRIAILAFLVLCLSAFSIKMVSNKTTSIFLADVSDSCKKYKTTMEQMIKDVIKTKGTSDSVGVVCFGSNAEVEQSPSVMPDFSSIQTKTDSGFTNIQQAMKLASSLMQPGESKRIILLSDGAENAGDAIKQARILKQQNIVVDVMPLANQDTGEVQLKEIKLPDAMKLNQSFDISVSIRSTADTKGTLRLYADRTLVSEKSIDIKKGDNNIVFSETAKQGGFITYSAEIDPAVDKMNKNNKLSAFSYIDDIPKLLMIQDIDMQGSELAKILGSDVDIKVIHPENAPTSVSELQKYDAFILSNVSAEKLDDKFLKSLETCIKYQGKGLLVTGGDKSYAPGGYSLTELEKILPVKMDVSPKEKDPNLGLVLVIDKSGSMNEGQYDIAKIDLAKEAAIRSAEVLQEKDMIGIIAFDDSVQWVVKMQHQSDIKKIQDAIGTISANGGTQILNPLELAFQALADADTKLKHIILLTDGEAEISGYGGFIDSINKAGITLSTVAVGSLANRELLEYLAKSGKGRFYETNEFSDIPKIFAKETIQAENKYFNNRTFSPSLRSNSDILKGINEMPILDGYVGTTSKSEARVILASDMSEPVLAAWQYGLGRTVAWTSDAAGMWTKSFLKWDQAAMFWRNMVSYVIGEKSSYDFSLKTILEPGEPNLELTLSPDAANTGEKADAVLVSPSGKEQTVTLDPTSPGTYKGNMQNDEKGAYSANINIMKGGKSVKSIKTLIIIPYSQEYNIADQSAGAFMEKLAWEGGGVVLKNSEELFASKLPPVISNTDMTNQLLILVILLLLVEIIFRRVKVDFKRIRSAADHARRAGEVHMKKFFKLDPSGKMDENAPDANTGKDENGQAMHSGSSKTADEYISVLLERKKNRK